MTNKVISSIQAGVQDLFPGYFALVMATGIVSIAAHLHNMVFIAQLLFALNKLFYLILWLLVIARLILYVRRVTTDLADHMRGPGFFTMVAGTCVLGSQYVIVGGDGSTAGILWVTGLVLWLGLMYAIIPLLMVKEAKSTLETGINGAWLIAVVATQSISVLGTLISVGMEGSKEVLLFFTLCMYLLGGMLYILIITLIFYRLLFFRLESAQVTPPYWVSMGAMAISTLAGDTLMLNSSQWAFLGEVLPFIKGLTLFFWATATWWIPILIILGWWRHITKRFPLRYDPAYWSLVFPLGMYTVCTFQLARALEMPFLLEIPRYFVFIALAAWLVAFAGLVNHLVRGLMPAQTVPE